LKIKIEIEVSSLVVTSASFLPAFSKKALSLLCNRRVAERRGNRGKAFNRRKMLIGQHKVHSGYRPCDFSGLESYPNQVPPKGRR